MSTLERTDSKPFSMLLPRAIANLIDAILIAVIDSVLMYVFWVIGMACGILDASPEHWFQLLCTIPLFVLDGITLIAAPAAIIYLNSVGAFPDQTSTLANLFFAAVIVTNWLYHAEFESSTARGTPGKVFMDLAVMKQNGRPVDFLRASLRHFAKALSASILCVGFLPLFGRKKQSLHDTVSQCTVLNETT